MKMQKKLLTWMTVGSLVLGSMPAMAAQDDEPSAGAMVADLVVARPVGLIATVLGSAAFVVSLPFSAIGGNVDQAADALVKGPARTTFVRCLGCANDGKRLRVASE